MDETPQVDVNRVIAIIREENPMVLELAMRRAFIEQQAEVIAGLRDRLSPDQVSPGH